MRRRIAQFRVFRCGHTIGHRTRDRMLSEHVEEPEVACRPKRSMVEGSYNESREEQAISSGKHCLQSLIEFYNFLN